MTVLIQVLLVEICKYFDEEKAIPDQIAIYCQISVINAALFCYCYKWDRVNQLNNECKL